MVNFGDLSKMGFGAGLEVCRAAVVEARVLEFIQCSNLALCCGKAHLLFGFVIQPMPGFISGVPFSLAFLPRNIKQIIIYLATTELGTKEFQVAVICVATGTACRITNSRISKMLTLLPLLSHPMTRNIKQITGISGYRRARHQGISSGGNLCCGWPDLQHHQLLHQQDVYLASAFYHLYNHHHHHHLLGL
jgi:hypothetical protein